jgi:hypothetical protein
VCELLYYTYWVVLFSCVSVCMWDPDPQQSLLFSPVTCRVDCSLAVDCHLHVMRIHFVLLEMQRATGQCDAYASMRFPVLRMYTVPVPLVYWNLISTCG